ncbi:MAG: transglycosylase SLT domain-containing protein [Acidobacteriota bacterium]|nr:transglycosylase SLT domain-containing protein [Acidobacteriota bacterium]
MPVTKVDLFSRPTETGNEPRQGEVQRQNARETFGALNKNIKSASDQQKPARDLWSDDASRQQTFEELKTLVRAVQVGETDPFKLTDLIFYARHPEMIGKSLANQPELLDEWNSISAMLVHPTLNEVGNILGANLEGGEIKGKKAMETAFVGAANSKVQHLPISGVSNHLYDEVIARSVEWCPGLSPTILKSLLAQESNFRPNVINSYGYAGIAQFGRSAAREVGLNVGIAGSASDERLNPEKAIPASARLLNIKAKRLGEIAFSKYGQPNGTEFWKFVLAAYNGGEGTVALAMGNAHRVGVEKARANGLVGADVVRYARNYASNWDNLKIGGTSSPLGQAAARYFPTIAAQKYVEIGNYPTQIVGRTKG